MDFLDEFPLCLYISIQLHLLGYFVVVLIKQFITNFSPPVSAVVLFFLISAYRVFKTCAHTVSAGRHELNINLILLQIQVNKPEHSHSLVPHLPFYY